MRPVRHRRSSPDERVSGIFTHFIREEDATMMSGRLDEELRRMSAIADQISPHCLMLFNESFAATNEREGSEIGRQVVRALAGGRDQDLLRHPPVRLRRQLPAPGRRYRRCSSGLPRLPDGRRRFQARSCRASPDQLRRGHLLPHRRLAPATGPYTRCPGGWARDGGPGCGCRGHRGGLGREHGELAAGRSAGCASSASTGSRSPGRSRPTRASPGCSGWSTWRADSTRPCSSGPATCGASWRRPAGPSCSPSPAW